MKSGSIESFRVSAELPDNDPPIDEEYFESVGASIDEEIFETDYDYRYLTESGAVLNWSPDLSSIPFNIEIVVAWNFTNSTHTKTLVIRKETEPDILWFDSSEHCINLSDAKYWLALPELPE